MRFFWDENEAQDKTTISHFLVFDQNSRNSHAANKTVISIKFSKKTQFLFDFCKLKSVNKNYDLVLKKSDRISN